MAVFARLWICAWALGCLLPLSVAGQSATVGFVLDGPWTRNAEVLSAMQAEITSLVQGEFAVHFPEEKQRVADWTVPGVRAALDGLLGDADVDVVIAAGVLASQEAIGRKGFEKHVVAAFVLNPELQNAPMEAGASGIRNLSYIAFPADLAREIRLFHDIVSFQHLAFVYRPVLLDATPWLPERVLQSVSGMGFAIDFVPVRDVDSAFDQLPEDADAVFVAPLMGISDAQVGRLIAGFNARKLPTYSVMGTREVEQGMLVGVAPDFDIPRLARRVALNVQRGLLGEAPSTFQVLFSRGEQLTINMATAREIGVYPSWEILTEATLIHEQRQDKPVLTLPEAVREALVANRDLEAARRAVAIGSEAVGVARAHLLPQLETAATGSLIDADLGSPQQAERSLSGGLQLQQVVFSESAWAHVSIQKSLLRSREHETEQVRLDVAQAAASAYLNVLRAKAFERIQKENLRVSRSNLELARVRQSVGASGPGEVYRWESQIASDQRAVIGANAQRNLSEIALNQVLHRPLEAPFEPVDIGLDDPQMLLGAGRLFPYISNPWNFKLFRTFLVKTGVSQSPELRQLDAAIAAQTHAVDSARRAFWMPTVAAQADWSRVFWRDGAGSAVPQVGGNVTWTAGLRASFPLYLGGKRLAESRRSGETLSRLRLEREAVRWRVEQRIRAGVHEMGASFAGIHLSQSAAHAAHKNLELVVDAYSRGVVTVLDLIDAQNAARVADQASANAIYDFLLDLIAVDRAAGQSSILLSPVEIEAFFEQLRIFFEANGVKVAPLRQNR